MSRKSTLLEEPPLPVAHTPIATHPTPEDIASRAHQIFLERGATPGRELDDWLQAERELNSTAKACDSPRLSAPSIAPLANRTCRR
jgi:hypothetical protein